MSEDLDVTLKDLVASPDTLMGVKAVWGRSTEGVMCFGSRGNPTLKDRGHYTQARITAEKSQKQPYFLTIGGGKEVPGELSGRVLEVVRATGIFGETTAFVRDEKLRARLAQWPVAVVVSEVYSIAGEPHLIEDLGFPDRRILTNAFDAVIRDDERVPTLWDKLRDWKIERRWDVELPPGFRDSGKVELCGSMYPQVEFKSPEGVRIWKLSIEIERNPKLSVAAKAHNRARNGGRLKCEACGFSDDLNAMFDAHHQQPLAAGVRQTRVDDLAVLCPRCHRWAHSKGRNKFEPVSVLEVSRAQEKCGKEAMPENPANFGFPQDDILEA